MQAIDDKKHKANAETFCTTFLACESGYRFIFGTNDYSKSIADQIEVEGFINDLTNETQYLGKPIFKLEILPENAMVVSAVTGVWPLTVEKKLSDAGVRHLDYYSFYEYSGLDIKPVMFWASFKADYKTHRTKYDWIENLLHDEESRRTYRNIIDFRLSANLAHMFGYTDRQPVQYWEDFLDLKQEGEVFVDVGGFDGYTSEEFIKRCPDYRAVYIFEPEQENMLASKERLGKFSKVHFMQMGLSNQRGTVRFSPGGSSSIISEDGVSEILVDTLDDCVDDAVSYIKMDIEGAEGIAIEGAEKTILEHHPRLAICVYHKPDCLWKIPEQVLAIRDDYDIYIRHYTEGVTETVMFFIPNNPG